MDDRRGDGTGLTVQQAVEHAYRSEWGRVLAGVAARVGDLSLAEDATADAFTAALTVWPESGVPVNPGGWLQTTAYRRAIDRLRRSATHDRKLAELESQLESQLERTTEAPADSPIPDERLELIFCCCHPAFAVEAQVALTLRCVAGLGVAEIADAFLVSEQTMAKRLVRAKQKVRDAHVPLRVPSAAELHVRLPAVLSVVYLVYNQGYDESRSSPTRAELCSRALDLGRLLVDLLPDEPEVLGLMALMLLHESRRAARVGADGSVVLLADQDRSKWDLSAAQRAGRLLNKAWRRPGCGQYVIEAAIAAVHASARRYEDTDWAHIVRLYDLLCTVNPGPVAAMNRAVAIGLWQGADVGLTALDPLTEALSGYQYFHASRADFLRRLGRGREAREAYQAALRLSHHDTEIDFLKSRLESLDD